MKKEVYVLIGPAAIGKTTYLKSVGFPESKLKIVSRDDIVLQMCKKYKLTHDELYLFPPHDSKIGDRIPGFEKYGIVVESPELIKHLHPFSYDYLNKINIEIYNSFYERFESAVKFTSMTACH
jgi:ABC-type polar amino acid transport system ATPase subunit